MMHALDYFTPERTAELMAAVGRKAAGIDCTEHESVLVLAYFDLAHPDTFGARVASLFPLECDQWWSERGEGWR